MTVLSEDAFTSHRSRDSLRSSGQGRYLPDSTTRNKHHWGWIATGGVALHFVVSFLLVAVLVSAAYAFAADVPGGGEVSSFDQLTKLGPSPGLALVWLVGIGMASATLTCVAVCWSPTRKYAWIVPAIGILLSVLAVLRAVSDFLPPAPETGG